MVSLTKAEIDTLAQRVEPEVTRWLAEKPAKNALEALLLMVQAIYALLQPPVLPVPYKEMVELAQTLAQGYDFAITWPYTREQMEAAMSPGHPDLRPNIPDEHILFVAGEVEERPTKCATRVLKSSSSSAEGNSLRTGPKAQKR